MERRFLKAIINPAMIATWGLGLWLAGNAGWWHAGWLHAKIGLVVLLGPLVDQQQPGPKALGQLRLAHNREPCMAGVDHRFPPIQAQRSKAFYKKSRSTTS